MVKKATSGEEYKILKQTSTPKKIAKILILAWTICVIAPVMYVCLTQAVLLKEFAVVKSVGALNGLLQNQYTNLTSDVIQKVDIQKYTSQIKVPEIKLDQVTETTEKVAKVSGALAKLGVKNADKVESSTKALQEQLNQANTKLQASIEQIQKTLETDIQAALGVSQIKKLEKFKKRRREIVDFYNKNLNLPHLIEQDFSNACFHLYPILVENREKFYHDARKIGLNLQVHYIPVHTQPYYRQFGYNWGDYPNAENYYKKCISLPLYPDLTDKDLEIIIKRLDTIK